jgi:uncharacterized lipoprotein YbaY
MSTLTCRIVFVGQSPRRGTPDVYVRLEDVSLADAAATLVAQAVVRQVPITPREGSLEVALEVDSRTLEPRRQYSLRAHVDYDQDGVVTPGDYVSTQSYPLQGGDIDAGLQVEVRRVG